LIEDDGTGSTPEDICVARTPITWEQAAGVLTIGAAEDPHGVLPRTRTWTVTFLGLPAGEPIRLEAPAGEAVRVEAGANPQPRTVDRDDAMFAVLNAAHYDHSAKAKAWHTLSSDLPPAAKLAELHAQALPRELIGALSELLTARG
jgi:hypothetical protein